MTESVPTPATLPPAPAGPTPFTPGDERTWAMLAHLSVLLNLITGVLGTAAALGVYLYTQNRSRYVAYHALQSFVMQLIWWIGGGAIIGAVWAITGITSIFLIGLLLIPIACLVTLMPLFSLGYGVWGAIETSQGKDFKYWLIGDWVRGTLTG
jgi:hypothetical protein